MSVADVLRDQLSARPNAEAVSDGDGPWWTWRDLEERSGFVVDLLTKLGIGRGDVVAILDVNRPSYFAVWFGAVRAGAILLALNTRFTSSELADVLEDSGARLVMVGPDFAEVASSIRSAGRAQAAEFAEVPFKETGGPSLKGDQREIRGGAETGRGQASSVELLLYTSGTTGRAKGVPLTSDNFGAVSAWCGDALELGEGSTASVYLPLFHVAGSSFALVTLAAGGRCVVRPGFDAVDFITSGTRYEVTHSLLVPSAISVVLDELDRRDDDLRLHLLGYGASPISDSLLVRAMDRFECRFVQFYGATETTGAITCLEPGDHRVDGPHLRSCGRPAPGVELRIVDPTSSAVADVGQVGEVCVRSKQVMSGYWRRPEASATVIDAEGWFHTGDLGYCDVDGYLYIHDRLKDMIVTGGENVYAAEVENVLEGHRAVAEVAVIGIPSERWGEQVHALVVRRPGQDVDEAVLVAYTRETLAGYKCPKSVDFVESLPRNPSGKVLRRELRAPFWEAHDRSIG